MTLVTAPITLAKALAESEEVRTSGAVGYAWSVDVTEALEVAMEWLEALSVTELRAFVEMCSTERLRCFYQLDETISNPMCNRLDPVWRCFDEVTERQLELDPAEQRTLRAYRAAGPRLSGNGRSGSVSKAGYEVASGVIVALAVIAAGDLTFSAAARDSVAALEGIEELLSFAQEPEDLEWVQLFAESWAGTAGELAEAARLARDQAGALSV